MFRRCLLATVVVLSFAFCMAAAGLWVRSGAVDEFYYAKRGGRLWWLESMDGLTLTIVAVWPNAERCRWITDPAGNALLPGLVRRGPAAWAKEWNGLGITYSSGLAQIPLRADGTACRSSEKDIGDIPVEHGFDHLSSPVRWWAVKLPHGEVVGLFAVLPVIWACVRLRHSFLRLFTWRRREPQPIRQGIKIGFLVTLATVIVLAAILVLVDKERHTDSLVLPLAVWAVGIIVGVVIGRRTTAAELSRHWRLHGMCERCGYQLTGNASGVCPECGSSIFLSREPPAAG